jgi:hypothetical protein
MMSYPPLIGFALLKPFLWAVFVVLASFTTAAEPQVLKPSAFARHVEYFNTMEDENVTNFVSNAESWTWLQQNIPLFECADPEVEEIYYFRWWSFRKHLKQTPKGFVFTEFLTPVSHAGEFNTISCAAGFHVAEGRWLRNDRYVNDYVLFWLRGDDGKPARKFHNFSSWLATAVYERYLVNKDRPFALGLLDDLVADYRVWEQERQLPNGLFWQFDVRDGMEESISGSRRERQARPTINSYMYANARAIRELAQMANRPDLAAEFDGKAQDIRKLTVEQLWNPEHKFFEVRHPEKGFANVREAIGFIPWIYHVPEPGQGYEIAWAQLTDPEGFRAPYGITTAERRHPTFRSRGVGTCEWDGAVWPFATSQTLYALANVLRDYSPAGEGSVPVAVRDYFDAFTTYVRSHRANGRPFIGEYMDEVTGNWINGKGGRSRYYNHSTFADVLITGAVGLKPRPDEVVEVEPLVPDGTWDWFCLDGVKYHGRTLTILWDKDGTRYGRGRGLRVLADGREIARSTKLERVTGRLP